MKPNSVNQVRFIVDEKLKLKLKKDDVIRGKIIHIHKSNKRVCLEEMEE